MTNPVDKIQRTNFSKKDIMEKAIQNPVLVMREKNNRSLYHFIEYFWPEYSNDKFVGNWHIEELCNQLEEIAERVAGNIPREYDLIANVPPGTSKTAVTSIFFPIWCWTKWHWMRFITASYGETLALESAEYSRDIMRSEKFKEMYPELEIRKDKEKKSNFKIIKKVWVYKGRPPRILQGGSRFSTSVGGTLTGFHGHINIVDDPLNPNQSQSDKEIARANHWVSQTLSTRKANKLTTTMIMIMQRLHQDDPAGHMLADPNKRIRHLCLPGEIRNHKKQVKPPELIEKYVDDLLDPKRMPWSVIKDLRAELGQYGYAGQIGQIPTPPGGGMFHIDHFQIVTHVDPTLIEHIIRYWDKAGTQGDGAFTAGVKLAKLKTGVWVVMDVKRGQWSTNNRENMITQTAFADGNHVSIYVEQEPGSGGKESAESTVLRMTKLGFKCTADRPQGDKIYRADPLSVQVNEGKIWILRGEWNKDYISEFEYFPFSTYKDQVDATSGGFAKLAGKKRVLLM